MSQTSLETAVETGAALVGEHQSPLSQLEPEHVPYQAYLLRLNVRLYLKV